MKTIVIHPKDVTTDFLSVIYKDQKDWTIVREKRNPSKLRNMVRGYQRIILLGHGSEYGLIGFNKYVVDQDWIYLLERDHIELVFIWCNADVFVKKYNLKPKLYTGMIISKMEEAVDNSVRCTGKDIEFSNIFFAAGISEAIDSENPIDCIEATYGYGYFNNVVEFNKTKIYSKLCK